MENKTNIPIVFSVDSNYIGALRVAIGSLVSNLNSSKYCIIYILHTELKSKTIIKFLNSCRFHNAKIIFLNIKSLVEKFTNKYKVKLYGTGHFTISMYYRFLIPFIFKKYKKVIYLDCDIIVKNDINDLYNVNIQDNYIGAIRDIVVENIKLKINCEYSVFINKILKIEDEKYFNSGVLIFNIDKCNQNKFVDNCFKSLSLLENNLYCPDQDVLNYVCKNKVYYISFKWNFMWNIESVVEKYKEVYLDKRIICDFESSKKNPYIIHYCDYFKPWSHPYLPYADCWWKYARETPFYEEILFDNISKFNQNHYKPYGAVDRIKNQLSYKIGKAIIKAKNPIKALFLPLTIIYLYILHKIQMMMYNVLIRINPNIKLIPLEQYADYNEMLKCKKYLFYRLGNAFIKNPLTFIFKIKKIYKEWKNGK